MNRRVALLRSEVEIRTGTTNKSKGTDTDGVSFGDVTHQNKKTEAGSRESQET